MNDDDDLWDKYCKFYEQDFEEQLEHNEKIKEEHFKRWKKTKMADQLCPEGADSIKDVPITTYEDYSILHKFGEAMDEKIKDNPRKENESWEDYYNRIEKGPDEIVDGWIPGKFEASAKTSGSTGNSKWFVYTKDFFEKYKKDAIAMVLFSASEEWGSTKLERGDVILHMGVPIPYLVGYTANIASDIFEMFPPFEVTDNMTDMKVKLHYILKELKKGQKVDVAAAMGSTFHLFAQSLVNPDKLYYDYFKATPFGLRKIAVYLLYLKAKLTSNKVERAKDVLPVKGLITGGLEANLYSKYLKKQFGSYPLVNYGSTELGVIMIGMPHRKQDMIPNLRTNYLEFIDGEGEIHEIDELDQGEVYKLIGTPYGNPLIRYDQGDMVKVIDFRDDGLPIFRFESREKKMLDIRNYFKINEATAFEIMKKAGFKNTNNWAVTKRLEGDEYLLFLLEDEWSFDEREAEKRLYDALYETSQYFRNFVKDYKVMEPHDVIKVEYLKRGAFKRYTLDKMDGDKPIGQYKSPNIIPPSEKEELELLRRV